MMSDFLVGHESTYEEVMGEVLPPEKADVEAFEEQIMIDLELAKQVMELYYYTDGTTMQDHMSDEELYAYAVRKMVAVGMMDNTVLVSKPSIWAQYIDN